MGVGEAAEADGDGEDETLLAPEGEVGHRQAALLRLRRAQPRQVGKGKKLLTTASQIRLLLVPNLCRLKA